MFNKTILHNQVRVVSESHTNCRSVSIGVWIETGTRDEPGHLAGVSHLLEHLVFKGTKKRSAFEIAKSLEMYGGELNAFTSKEHVCFQALVLHEHWLAAVDVLCDLVTNMQISKQDLDLEKKVVLQEIGMAEENYEEIIYDDFFKDVYERHALGKPILGTPGSIFKMKKRDIEAYYKSNYVGRNIVVSAAGSIDHLSLVNEIEKRLGRKVLGRRLKPRKSPPWKRFYRSIEKPSEQMHLLLGFPVVGFGHRMKFQCFVLNALLGGGMTSRLYQSVREKRGLAYTIQSSLNTFSDSGLILIYAQTDPKNVKKLVDVVMHEVNKIRKKGMTQSEFDLFKTQIVGAILLGSEDVESRMASIAINEMTYGEYRPVSLVIEQLQKITYDSVCLTIDRYLDVNKFSGLLLGANVAQLGAWWEG